MKRTGGFDDNDSLIDSINKLFERLLLEERYVINCINIKRASVASRLIMNISELVLKNVS